MDNPLVAVLLDDLGGTAVEIVGLRVVTEAHRVADMELGRRDELLDGLTCGEPVVRDMGDLDEVRVKPADVARGGEWSDVDLLVDAFVWRGIDDGIEEGLGKGGSLGLAELSARS